MGRGLNINRRKVSGDGLDRDEDFNRIYLPYLLFYKIEFDLNL